MLQNAYSIVFYTTTLICVSYALKFSQNRFEYSDTKVLAFFYAIFTGVIMGLKEIPIGSYADREFYAMGYNELIVNHISWEDIIGAKEWVFTLHQHFWGFLNDAQGWLVVTALIYVLNYYWGITRLFRNCEFLMLAITIVSMGFYAYGVNTIRAGLALSFVFVGVSYYRHLWKSLLLFFIAFNIHNSMAIPIGAFLVAKYFDKPKFFYGFWFVCVFLSLAMGGYFQTLFADWGGEAESRVSYLTTTETHYNAGFRIDFVLYGILPILAGYYYQFKLNYQNKFYSILYGMYVLSNAFWVLVIRANFSDRFAYLSWFIYPFVLLYPLIHDPEHFNRQEGRYTSMTMSGWIIWGNIAFLQYVS